MASTQEQAIEVMTLINKTLLATRTSAAATPARITAAQQTAVVTAFNTAFSTAHANINAAIAGVVAAVQSAQDAPNTLKANFTTWISGTFAPFSDDNLDERSVRDWIVPATALNSQITP